MACEPQAMVEKKLQRPTMETTTSARTVQQAIQEFYHKNDFGEDGGVNQKIAWIKFGFFSLPMPNFESRKDNVYLHDVSHIVTGNNTTWQGESAVSAWEVASGGWSKLYIPWLLTLWAMGLGMLFYNRSTVNAFKQGLTMHNALSCGLTRNEINRLTVDELKKVLSGKPKSKKSILFWSVLSLGIFVFPILVTLLSILVIIKFI